MSKSVVFATANPNKAIEVGEILIHKQIDVSVKSLSDFNITADIPEDYKTLENNARHKAAFVFDKLQRPCFGEDTGLEVEALDNAPGVRTARYAGPDKNPRDNMRKLLKELDFHISRSARFRTIISFTMDGRSYYYFEGICNGRIAIKPSGNNGFGYDPIFIPNGYEMTFAELNPSIKNKISHRFKAVSAFADFIRYRRF